MTEYLTDAGKDMLSRMLAGKVTIDFTKIQIGDGDLKTNQTITSMTELVNVVKTLDVQSVEVSEENTVIIKAVFDNNDLNTGFYFKEKGIWATDGRSEILFAYGNARSAAQYINPPTTELIEKQIISIYKTLQDVNTQINIKIKSGVYATQEDLEEAEEELQKEINKLDKKVNDSCAVVTDVEPPTNLNKIWLDISGGAESGILKYYNPQKEEWTAVKAVWG